MVCVLQWYLRHAKLSGVFKCGQEAHLTSLKSHEASRDIVNQGEADDLRCKSVAYTGDGVKLRLTPYSCSNGAHYTARFATQP